MSMDIWATERQVEVLCLRAMGYTYADVAEHLKISQHTVVRHSVNMQKAFGASNGMQLVAMSIIGGLIKANRWPLEPTGQLLLRFP